MAVEGVGEEEVVAEDVPFEVVVDVAVLLVRPGHIDTAGHVVGSRMMVTTATIKLLGIKLMLPMITEWEEVMLVSPPVPLHDMEGQT